MTELKNYEVRRKAVHLCLGLILGILVFALPAFENIIFLLSCLALATILSLYTKYRRPKLIVFLLGFFDKPEDMIKFPGKGAVFYLVGALLAVALFEKNVAAASLFILAVGDPAAHITGKYFGKNKLPINSKKCLEGSLAGIFAGTIAAAFAIPLHAAFIGAVSGMVAEAIDIKGIGLDDNFSIPVTAGIVMSILLSI